jgi:hypothetical protein
MHHISFALNRRHNYDICLWHEWRGIIHISQFSHGTIRNIWVRCDVIKIYSYMRIAHSDTRALNSPCISKRRSKSDRNWTLIRDSTQLRELRWSPYSFRVSDHPSVLGTHYALMVVCAPNVKACCPNVCVAAEKRERDSAGLTGCLWLAGWNKASLSSTSWRTRRAIQLCNYVPGLHTRRSRLASAPEHFGRFWPRVACHWAASGFIQLRPSIVQSEVHLISRLLTLLTASLNLITQDWIA